MPSNPGHSGERDQSLKEHVSPKGMEGSESLPPAGDIDHNAPTLPPRSIAGSESESGGATPQASISDPADSSLTPHHSLGTRVRYFGDYELLEEIARGGMGVVYKARQVSLNRIVAVKMILAGQLAGQDDVRRFRTEAEAAAQLQHLNIVAIHEVGEHGGQHYFSMDYVDGTSLAALVRENPLPAKQAARYVKIIAEAIHYAHQKGILHRDLKPSNVLLSVVGSQSSVAGEQKAGKTEHGQLTTEFIPKITDFGLAKRIEARGAGSSPASALTGTGQVLGTPSYMPPEQAAGKRGEIGPASDVYSLGAILYELVTGRPPFRAETPLDTLLQVLDVEPVSLRLLNPRIDRDLETICLKCLQKEAGRRYASAQALADDLGCYLNGEPIHARPVSSAERLWRWCRRNPRVAALSTSVLALLATVAIGSTIAAFWIRQAQKHAEQGWSMADENYRMADTARNEAIANLATAQAERSRAEANFIKAREAVDRMLTQVGQQRLRNIPQMEPVRRALLEDAIQFYQGFLEQKSTDPAVRLEAGEAYQRIGRLYNMLGQADQANHAYQHAIELNEKLVEDFPDDHAFREALSRSYGNHGLLLNELGRFTEAEQAYGKSIAIHQELAAKFPQTQEYQDSLAGSWHNLALLREFTERREEAANAYRRAVEIEQALVQRFPASREYRAHLAKHRGSLGSVLRKTGQHAEAEEHLRRCTEVEEQLVADFPTVADYRNDLGKTHHALGVLLDDSDRTPQAEGAFRRAAELHEKLATDFPQVIEYRQDLAAHYNSLGIVLASLGRADEAEREYRRALEIKEKLVGDFPQIPLLRGQLANSYKLFGGFLLHNDRGDEAEEPFQKGTAVLEQLVKEFPKASGFRSALGAVFNDRAMIAKTRDPVQARGLIEQALEHQQVAIQLNPKDNGYRRFLRNHYSVLADTLVLLGEHAAAVHAAAELSRVFSDSGTDAYRAACLLARCIPLAEKDAQLSDAERRSTAQSYASRAIELLRQAVSAGFKDFEQMNREPELEPIRDQPGYKELIAKGNRQG